MILLMKDRVEDYAVENLANYIAWDRSKIMVNVVPGAGHTTIQLGTDQFTLNQIGVPISYLHFHDTIRNREKYVWNLRLTMFTEDGEEAAKLEVPLKVGLNNTLFFMTEAATGTPFVPEDEETHATD